jgi:hypothetical protein
MKRINVLDGVVDFIEIDVSEEQSKTHPFVIDDDVEVFAGYISNGDGTFTAPATPPATIDEIKAEAGRRIIEILPTWKQNNFIAKESELLAAENGQLRDSSGVKLPARELTSDEIAQLAYIKSAWDWAVSVRTASDLIEQTPPLISDLQTDSRWPGAFA